jgi:hypothetical protein
MKKLFYAVLAVCGLLSAVSCEDAFDTEIASEVKLGLRVDEVGQNEVYLRLTHDGAADEYWFCMEPTDNFDADAREILERTIRNIIRQEGNLTVRVGVNRSLAFEGLQAQTRYRAIAAMVNDKAEIVGEIAEVTFETKRDPAVFTDLGASGLWRMSWSKRITSSDDDLEYDVFKCEVTDTSHTFVPMIISKADFKNYYYDDHRSFFEDYVESSSEENVKWNKVIRNKTSEYTQERLRSGEYWMFMIGVTEDGELTGYYAQEERTFVQEQQTAEYAKWLGLWTLTEITPSSKPIQYNVTITAEENNLYLRMAGWEYTDEIDAALREVPFQLPVLLYFEKSTGYVYVVSEEMAELPTVAAADMYDFYLYGLVSMDSNLSLINIPNLRIARFVMNDDERSVTVTPERFTYTEGDKAKSALFESFCYTYIWTLWPELSPLTPDVRVISLNNLKMEKIG